ncbi:hypothetical protein FACS189476_09510 [Spirochaetia bacterium]|nr:hypothetical protein FACS189476_09510 [Spirochaetia bacterium]
MPQIALNVDEITLEKINNAAKQRKTTISAWVENNIKNILKNDFSNDFFDLFGAIDDDTFVEPEKIAAKYDLPREQI